MSNGVKMTTTDSVSNEAKVVTISLGGCDVCTYVEVGKNDSPTSTYNAALFLNLAKDFPVKGKNLLKRSGKEEQIKYFIGKGTSPQQKLISLSEEEAQKIAKEINQLMKAAKEIKAESL